MTSREKLAALVCLLGCSVCLVVSGCESKEKAQPEPMEVGVEMTVSTKPGAPPPAVVRKCKAAPTIDGDLADACWKAARIPGVWIDLNTGEAAKPQPTAYVCYDDANVYVAVLNPEPEMQNVIAYVSTRDGAVWNDDSNEIFLDPSAGKKGYYQIMVNTNGVLCDGQAKDSSWNMKGEVKVKKMADGWSAEFAIPLSDLGVTGSPKGQTWTANFRRNRLGAREPHSWSDTGPDQHNFAAFGKLKME